VAITCSQTRFQYGYRRHVAGDVQTAAQVYAEVLQIDPKNADAWHLSGLIAFQKKQFADSEQLIRHALTLRPDEPVYEANLAAALLATDKNDEAELCCRRVLRLDPEHLDAMKHLGTALRKQHRSQEAFDVCQLLVRKAPSDPDALCNLGALLSDMGRIDEAHDMLLKARGLNDRLPQIHLNLGSVQRHLGHFVDAMKSLNQAASLAPGLTAVLINRGNLLLEMCRPDQALQDFYRALEQNPKSISALSGLGIGLQVQGCWSEAMDAFRLASQLIDNFPTGVSSGSQTHATSHRRLKSNLIYYSSLSPGLLRSDVFKLHASWGRSIEQGITPFEHPQGTQLNRGLRIGYLSPDFRRHATMRFFLPFFAEHDRNVVETVCYSETTRVDEVTHRVQGLSDRWRPTYGMTDQQLAEAIRDDQIDILIDVAGHTSGNRLPSLAWQPAPVQVSFLGYPNTTGLSRVQYFLTDAIREDSQTANFFTEQLIAMPHGAACFDPGDADVRITEPPQLRNGYITLGSTHRLEKLSPECIGVWVAVMNKIPDARLLLIRDVLGSSETLRQNLLRRLVDAGIQPHRVDMSWDVPSPHLEIYSTIDILLDVFPWPSGTTSYESTWMGVPMPGIHIKQQDGISISAEPGCTRSSASFLHQIGLKSLIAASVDDYVELVANLATDVPRLCHLRRSMRQQMIETVCNGVRFSRDLESIYRAMWYRHCGVPVEETGLPLLKRAKAIV